MKNLLSKRQIDVPRIYSYLCAIWYVDADDTYCIVKNPGTYESDYIAVRTVKGCGILTEFNHQVHELNEHTLGIFRSSDVMRYEADVDGWEFFWFRFNHSNWNEFINQVHNLRISTFEYKEMEYCFASLNSGVANECMAAEALFNYLLSDWLVRLKNGQQDRISLQEIVLLLEKGRHDKLNLSEIAREAGMSERSFRSTVHRVCGMSPKEYITKIEMETAMDLLRTTHKSISEISCQLNYDNPFYFSRVFKKFFGISPTQARMNTSLSTIAGVLPTPEKSIQQIEKEQMERLKAKAKNGKLMLDE